MCSPSLSGRPETEVELPCQVLERSMFLGLWMFIVEEEGGRNVQISAELLAELFTLKRFCL